MKKSHWVAVCAYPGKDEFIFYSPSFVADWDELEKVAAQCVHDAWGKISPYPAPPVIRLEPGYLEYHSCRTKYRTFPE